jgi:hypothetical protein
VYAACGGFTIYGGGRAVYYAETWGVCVFITAVPITKLIAVGEGVGGGAGERGSRMRATVLVPISRLRPSIKHYLQLEKGAREPFHISITIVITNITIIILKLWLGYPRPSLLSWRASTRPYYNHKWRAAP